MKKYLLILSLSFSHIIQSQTLYNGPDYLLPNSSENYASVLLPNGVNVNWSISTNATIQGSTTNPLVFFDLTISPSPVVLTATMTDGTSIVKSIPIVQSGPTLVESTTPITMVNGIRQHQISQLLRGQRVKVTPTNFTGANPTLTLLSSQGRIIQQGNSLDFRSPTRGLFYVVVNSTSTGDLIVEGISPNSVPTGAISASALTQPNCTIANLTTQIESNLNYTGSEYMITLGNKIITCVYDFVLNKTKITAYENDLVSWTWLSNDNEYIRTISGDSTYGIVGIGSSGGALKNEDNILVVKLNENGVLQTSTNFGTTNGKDFGYGISFLNDGSLVATGFTEGSFSGFTNAGNLDAFATHISTSGAVINTLQFGSIENDRIWSSRTLPNGNVLLFGDSEGVVGSNFTTNLGAYDLFLTEIQVLSNPISIQNSKQFGTAENDLAFDMAIEPLSGDFFITGQTTGEFLPNSNMITNGDPQRTQVYTARINKTTLNFVWVRQLGPNEGQSAESLALSSNAVGTIFYTFGNINGANNNSLGTPASDDMVISLFDFDGNLTHLYQFDQTLERIFARAITFKATDIYVLRDHVYEPGKPYITATLDKLTNPVLGIENSIYTSEKIVVYPNPFSNNINIMNLIGDETFILSNSLGEIIFKGKNISEQNFSNLPTGMYYLSSANQKFKTVKVLKK